MRVSFLPAPEQVRLDVPLEDKESAIRFTAGLLVHHPAVANLNGLTKAVLERESLLSTALPCGVALPHGRGSFVTDVVVAVTRLSVPVQFAETPVRLVIMVATPPSRTADHLALLAWWVKKMGDPAVLDRLLKVTSPERFCESLSSPGA